MPRPVQTRNLDINIGYTLTCDTCEGDIDCRIGMSNRAVQPLQLVCPHCRTLIHITLNRREGPGGGITYKNASQREDRAYGGPFDGRNPFFNLHLDFPVTNGKYVPGQTPFFVAMNALRHPSVGENAIQLMVTFAQKVGRLDDFQHSIDDLDRAIRLYFTPNKQLFKKRAGELIRRDLGPSMEPASIDDALYSLLHIAFSPMIDVQADETWTEQAFTKLNELSSQKREAFDQFLAALETTQFLKNLQLDCLRLYAQMYRAEISLRPAIFLDLIASTDSPLASGRVSAKDFGSYKDLYREMCEIYARQLILAAGLNNLDSRDDHNSFPPHKHGNPLSSLDNFADKALAEKLKYLKGGWIPLNLGAVDPSLRNAIAHTTTEYDETTQMITFFAEKEGMKRERGRMISYLDFMRELLILFREMHALHQLIYLVGHRIHVWRANGSSE